MNPSNVFFYDIQTTITIRIALLIIIHIHPTSFSNLNKFNLKKTKKHLLRKKVF